MKITEKQLHFLYQLAQDSVKMDIVGIFSYSIDQRVDVVNAIMNQQDGETLIDVSDDKPVLEPQYYKESKKQEKEEVGLDVSPVPEKKQKENFLHKAISLLRQWRQGCSGGADQFLLTTNTINFLDRFDKEACNTLKEDL